MSMKKQLNLKSWTQATFWGWLMGVFLILLLSSILDAMGIQHMQFYLGVGMGTGVGFMQWQLLRNSHKMKISWLLSSVIGMGIPFLLVDLFPQEIIAHKIATGISLGAITTSVIQYYLLKEHIPQAILWIPYNFTGWTMGVLTVFTIDYTIKLKPILSNNLILALINLALILAGGVILGLVTGLIWKKRQRSVGL